MLTGAGSRSLRPPTEGLPVHIDLTGKTALVTGSTQGIGRAIALGLARAGATVAVNGRTASRVDEAIAGLLEDAPGASFVAAPGDVSTDEGAQQVLAALDDLGDDPAHGQGPRHLQPEEAAADDHRTAGAGQGREHGGGRGLRQDEGRGDPGGGRIGGGHGAGIVRNRWSGRLTAVAAWGPGS